MTHHLFEDAIEVRQRLETDFEGDLANAQIRIQQKVLAFSMRMRETNSVKFMPTFFLKVLQK